MIDRDNRNQGNSPQAASLDGATLTGAGNPEVPLAEEGLVSRVGNVGRALTEPMDPMPESGPEQTPFTGELRLGRVGISQSAPGTDTEPYADRDMAFAQRDFAGGSANQEPPHRINMAANQGQVARMLL